MKSGLRSYSAAQHSHWVSVISEGIHHSQQIFVDKSVPHDLFGEGAQFFLGGKLSPDHKVSNFQKIAFLGKGLNRVTSVLKNAFVAIDEADGGGAGDGVHVSGVIAPEYFSLVGQFGKVGGFEEAVVGTKLVGFSGPGVCKGDGVLGRDVFGK